MDIDDGLSRDASEVENDFYYSVLNLPKTALQSEITEKYRALSLIFHPDRQHEEEYKSIATKKFLEIQKAYEVLSDPFLREVYDVLGEKGLTIIQSSQFRSIPREEAKKVLAQLKGGMASEAIREKEPQRGSLTCGVDAVSLFSPYVGSPKDTWPQRFLHRCEDFSLLTFGVRHVAQKSINERIRISGKAKMSLENRKLMNTLVGTVRHQFSPRFASECSVGLIPRFLRIAGTYNEAGTAISAVVSTPIRFHTPDPSIKFSASRQLFSHRPEVASFDLSISKHPHFAFNVIFPKAFGTNLAGPSEEPRDTSAPPSTSGLKIGSTHTLIGFSFGSIFPKLVAEWGVNFSEIALQLKIAVEFGLTGLGWNFIGKWAVSPRTSLMVATQLHAAGVVLRLDGTYDEQQLSIPILLSTEYSPSIALCSVILPSTAFVIGYHLVLKPRRRIRRLDSIRAARRALEEDSSLRREREAIAGMLKEGARKSKNAEASKDGLVIAEAKWGSNESEDGSRDLVIDVTIPLQALVHASQLYIPADRLKSGIRGFSDPAPFTRKILRIRYLFRGQTHYAEIPEELPVVLPLSEHLVE